MAEYHDSIMSDFLPHTHAIVLICPRARETIYSLRARQSRAIFQDPQYRGEVRMVFKLGVMFYR